MVRGIRYDVGKGGGSTKGVCLVGDEENLLGWKVESGGEWERLGGEEGTCEAMEECLGFV